MWFQGQGVAVAVNTAIIYFILQAPFLDTMIKVCR
jgi:hypothetical protein